MRRDLSRASREGACRRMLRTLSTGTRRAEGTIEPLAVRRVILVVARASVAHVAIGSAHASAEVVVRVASSSCRSTSYRTS
jgi:hypothetical protein